MSAPDGVVDALGRFVAQARPEPSVAVLDVVRALLLHNLGVMGCGRRAEPFAHRIARAHYPLPAEATLFADGSKASVEAAAFANAALMHARAQDDAHTPSTSHPGATVIPVALALAQAHRLSGRAFLDALLLGYEVQGRIGRPHSALSTPRGFRATTVYGVFGAAAAAARLTALAPDRSAAALAFAANLAGGLGRTWSEGTDEWRVQVGLAARNGIVAARLAEAGLRTAHGTLEGAAGFLRAFAGTDAHASELLRDLGERWLLDEVTIKRHPCCAILQGPVDAMLTLRETAGLSPGEVDSIEATFSPFEAAFPGNDNAGPFDSQGATLMSAQFCLALALVEGRITIDGLLRFAHPDVAALIPRVRVAADPALPVQAGRLRIADRSGRVHERAWTGREATPVVRFDAVAAATRALFEAEGPGAGAADRLADAVHALDRAPDVEALVACLVP